MTIGREVVSVSCGFWFGMMGLLVVAMVEVSFLSFFLFAMVGGGEWIWWLWVDVEVSFCCDFFSLFFVSGGCGKGGGFLLGGWCREKERETKEREIGERGKIKNY